MVVRQWFTVRLTFALAALLAAPLHSQAWAEPWPVIAPESVACAMLTDVRALDTTIRVL